MLIPEDSAAPASQAGSQPASRRGNRLRLEPLEGVQLIDGEFHAVALPCWLRLEPVSVVSQHRWVRFRYSTSYFDEPIRPLVRFTAANGTFAIQPMNGAILGSAEWIGRIPNNTVSIDISPSRRLGPFSFRLDSLRRISRASLVREGFFSDPPWLLWSFRSRLVNSREEAWQALKYARSGVALERYWEWRGRFHRAFDADGLDKPRAAQDMGPVIHLVTSLSKCGLDDLRATLQSLKDQHYPRWVLHAEMDAQTPRDLIEAFRTEAALDARLSKLDSASEPTHGLSDNDWFGTVYIGDLMPDYALAVAAEFFEASTHKLDAVYSDEDSFGQGGLFYSPLLKPDWSPRFHQSIPYAGQLSLFRVELLKRSGIPASHLLGEESAVTAGRMFASANAAAVGHIRRVLYHRKINSPKAMERAKIYPPAPAEWPGVSIVIPTRDRADLLAACVRGLTAMTDYPSFDITIMDNGSTQPEARALLDSLRTDARFTVLERPGPFNYSKLSNEGARISRSPILVFLNNDVEMLDAGWLKAMVRWAAQPASGAVGAKLLFPNGKIQHAGVVLGMGGIAGHVYRRGLPHASGYLDQLQSTHEVTAVTGACFAVARSKFEAIGGFDEENLPIDLNDMDLCLRLAERGWTNIWTPDAVLTHVQSASRGVERDPFKVYKRERSYFMHHWAEAIRDDPYFHPGFSLFAQQPTLA